MESQDQGPGLRVMSVARRVGGRGRRWLGVPVLIAAIAGSVFGGTPLVNADDAAEVEDGRWPAVFAEPQAVVDHLPVELDGDVRAGVELTSVRALHVAGDGTTYLLARGAGGDSVCLIVFLPGAPVTAAGLAEPYAAGMGCSELAEFNEHGATVVVARGSADSVEVVRAAALPDGYQDAAERQAESPHRNLMLLNDGALASDEGEMLKLHPDAPGQAALPDLAVRVLPLSNVQP